MAEGSTPVSIGKRPDPVDGLGLILGQSAADILRLHMSVIDREDRLESGTGQWLSSFRSDEEKRVATTRESVLRALRMASDATNFRILQSLTDGVGTPIENLAQASGLSRLALAERIGDLVSAGLASKIPEANQVAGVPAGAALVQLVESAASHASADLGGDV
ncbi:MAG: hypothetical protein ACC658_07110 [Acidimicrobiia bacterium]